jgi:acyl carrier protein
MSETLPGNAITEILWESLKGGNYDLPTLKRTLREDSNLEALGLDSLDITEFFIRIEDHYGIAIAREDYPRLSTLGAIQGYVKEKAVS